METRTTQLRLLKLIGILLIRSSAIMTAFYAVIHSADSLVAFAPIFVDEDSTLPLEFFVESAATQAASVCVQLFGAFLLWIFAENIADFMLASLMKKGGPLFDPGDDPAPQA